MTPDQVFNLRRVEIDAAHREHVIDAAADPTDHLGEGTTALARGPGQLDSVSGPIADQR